MNYIKPSKLKPGDEVRVVAPAVSLSIISEECKKLAEQRLRNLGLNVTYGKNVYEKNEFDSSTIKQRIEDLHDAFGDKNVKAILTVVGGYNSNQILKYLDYDIIKNNPKILCGFSDITALQNAILKKTGLITYSGPHFSSFGMIKGFEYTLDYFKKVLMSNEIVKLVPPKEWSDDVWFMDQENRTFMENSGYNIINEGEAEGNIVGDNLCTFNLLRGTEFMPSLTDSILFLEDDEKSNSGLFDRDLQSLIHLHDFKFIKGIVIGRFQKKSDISLDVLTKIIKSKKELDNIPIISNVDFGHTSPRVTFPIGGKVKIIAKKGKAQITI